MDEGYHPRGLLIFESVCCRCSWYDVVIVIIITVIIPYNKMVSKSVILGVVAIATVFDNSFFSPSSFKRSSFCDLISMGPALLYTGSCDPIFFSSSNALSVSTISISLLQPYESSEDAACKYSLSVLQIRTIYNQPFLLV